MDETQLKKRFAELAELSRRQNIYYYTDFLTPAEAADALAMTPERERKAFGGAENCERVMVRFGDPVQIGYEEPYPLAVVRICPQHRKFAEELSHRDYLGALMHLGLERDIFGDLIMRDGTAWVFVAERMAAYICSELTQVRHTQVHAEIPETVPAEAYPALQEEQVIAASARLDTVIAKVWHLSRAKAKDLVPAGAVQIGGRVCEKESVLLHPGEVISVRGYGKFRFGGQTGTTKKGSCVLRIEKYV